VSSTQTPAQRGRGGFYPGLLEKSDAPGPPPACPRSIAIGPRVGWRPLIGSLPHGACGPPLACRP
jgi:hypothetical protein